MKFPTTRWTQLAHATLHGDSAGQLALGEMCEHYRGAIVAFLTARGLRGAELDDAVQEFFLQWLRSRAWKRADRLRGRFRSFLLGALQHMLQKRLDYQGRQKRGGGTETASLDHMLDDGWEAPDLSDPAVSAYDRRWAVAVVENALARMEAEYGERKRAEEFALLRRFLPGSAAPPTLEEAGRVLQLSASAVKAAVFRLRQQFRQALRSCVAQTVSAAEEVEEEMQYLRELLTAGPQD